MAHTLQLKLKFCST